MTKTSVTKREYSELDRAYKFFNEKFFHSQLPPTLITLQRKGKAMGYFHGKRFKGVDDGQETVDELALNPDCFGLGDYETLNTLVHEMCHVWQAHHGKPSRNGYHNRQWAEKMVAIGLMPFDTKRHTEEDIRQLAVDQIKQTGQSVSDFPIPNGLFDRQAKALLASGWHIKWESKMLAGKRSHQRKKQNKVKYHCSVCGANAWGKPILQLMCGTCMVTMLPME